jgi:hypothetical protein
MTLALSFSLCPSLSLSIRYSEMQRRYDALNDEIESIEQELEADNDGQVPSTWLFMLDSPVTCDACCFCRVY